MSVLYLTLVAVLLSGLGARDQVTIANLSARQGKRPAVLIVGCVLAAVTAGFAGWAATLLIPQMQPAARVFLAALALAFAGGESLVLAPRAGKREPTHSLGALAAVLVIHQLTDAARFVIFGIAVGTKAPVLAALGGAVGGAALLALGWGAPHLVLHARMRLARRIVGAGFLAVGIYVGMRALGRI